MQPAKIGDDFVRPEMNVSRTLTQYFSLCPDPSQPTQRVAFGTSGHRGQSSNRSFNENHVLAIAQAIVEYRLHQGITGPLFVGKDTHALSEPAFETLLSVLLANNIDVIIQADWGYTPTPVISRLIIEHNRNNADKADGVIITPSHNPPEDGGIKYNPTHGGPAEGKITQAIESRANELLSTAPMIRRIDLSHSDPDNLILQDFISDYVAQLDQVIDMAAIKKAGVTIGVDPMGGAGLHYWQAIAKHYGVNIQITNTKIDPSFSFMPKDHDGKIRMDCSSPDAMDNLIKLKDAFDVAIGNDPDFDRHGIVTRTGGLMSPNHYLAVAIHYLIQHRDWSPELQIGKTLVSSALIDRVAKSHNRPLKEVPVGFKWFVDDLSQGSIAFGGEESAGASFLERNGQCWTTDKDGITLGLLAAEILAVTGQDPYQHYQLLIQALGAPCYRRMDVPATPMEKQRLAQFNPESLSTTAIAGEPILSMLSHAPGNGEAIGGIKVCTQNGWFAARPSGTENLYKIYAESFIDEHHLERLLREAKDLVESFLNNP